MTDDPSASAVPLERPTALVDRASRTVRIRGPLLAIVVAAVVVVALTGYRWLQDRIATTVPFVPPIDVYALLVDNTPVEFTVAAGGAYVPWRATPCGSCVQSRHCRCR
jgi:hypothetical protein